MEEAFRKLGNALNDFRFQLIGVLVDFTPWLDQHQRIDLLYSGQHVFNSAQGAMPNVSPESTTRGNDNFSQFQALWRRSLNSTTAV